jgi:Telomere resolvase
MIRQSIINSFRQAIAAGDRNKISKTDFDELIDDFVEQLAELKSKAKIKALCAAELALLEEGYPQATIAKVYLPRYRKAIKEATEEGFLPLTKATSYQYDYTKRNSGEEGTAIDHFALLYLKYDQALYSQLANAAADRNNQKQDIDAAAPSVIEPIPQPLSPIAPPSPPPPKTPSTDLGVITYRLNNLESAVTNIATLLQQQSALLQNLMISTSAQPPKISKAQGKIRRAIAAALEWNNAQPEKFAVTQTLIQKATGSNMPAVRSVFEDLAIQSLIADHHRAIGFENNLKQPKNTLAILNWIQEQLAGV